MGTAHLAYLTVAEYLAGEDLPGLRHEYVNGEIFAMAGASKAHGTLALNLALALRAHLRGKPCRTWASDMKVQVLAANSYYYPDVVVTCAADELGADSPQNFVSAPTIVIEVLSPSTEKVDRREKWFAYRQVSSLQEYVLVDQERQWVEVFRRHEGGWMQDIVAAGESMTLPSIGLTLALNDIYEDSGVPEFSTEAAL